jgi:hypothetical protein
MHYWHLHGAPALKMMFGRRKLSRSCTRRYQKHWITPSLSSIEQYFPRCALAHHLQLLNRPLPSDTKTFAICGRHNVKCLWANPNPYQYTTSIGDILPREGKDSVRGREHFTTELRKTHCILFGSLRLYIKTTPWIRQDKPLASRLTVS